MDVARTSLAFVITLFGFSFQTLRAQQPSYNSGQRSAYTTGQSGWQNAGPTTAPTITASGQNYDRYGYPQSATRAATGQPPTIPERAQNAVTETANTLRDGYDATVRAANQQFSNASNAVNQQYQSWNGTSAQQSPFTTGTARNTGQSYNTTSTASKKYKPVCAGSTGSANSGESDEKPKCPQIRRAAALAEYDEH